MPKRGRPRGSKNIKKRGIHRVKISKTLADVQPAVELAEQDEAKEIEHDFAAPIIAEERPKRKRGRPRGSKNRTIVGETLHEIGEKTGELYDKKQIVHEASEKSQIILTVGTSIGGKVYPPMKMTDEEAEWICDPGASIMVRHLGVEQAKEFIDRFDYFNFALGLTNYAVRVYEDDKAWREERKAERNQKARDYQEAKLRGVPEQPVERPIDRSEKLRSPGRTSRRLQTNEETDSTSGVDRSNASSPIPPPS
jgi:hypothetical protein